MWLWLAIAGCGETAERAALRPVLETADTACVPPGYSCVDVVDADGACAPDGVLDFDPGLPLGLDLGVVVEGACVRPPTSIPVVFGVAGGWSVDLCFGVTDAPLEVGVVAGVTVIPTGADIAGSEADDRQAVRLDAWSDGTCAGSATVRAHIDDDPTWRGGPPAEQVCGWQGVDLRVSAALDADGRLGNAWWIAPAVLVDASTGEAYACP